MTDLTDYRINSEIHGLQQKLHHQNEKYEKKYLKSYATMSAEASRKFPEQPDYRNPYTRDADRIIHSLSYARFFDKTQVFFWIESDMHQHRMLHVQLVSKLAREIGQVLGLNQDLIEAIALGHDIGHVPFGHDGEDILSRICQENHIGYYRHNHGSIWFLQEIEMQNLTLPVLDGILCHNGEKHGCRITPQKQKLTWDNLALEQEKVLYSDSFDPRPKTMEGALVRIVDTISYISRDIMDAEHLGITSFQNLPKNVKETLGTNNREIINTLVSDLIQNSYNKPYISYSAPIFDALQDLYSFNLAHIYLHPDKQPPLKVMEQAMRAIWDQYLSDLNNNRRDSKIFTDHLNLNLKIIQTRYPEIRNLEVYPYYKQPPEIITRDFIAGMTDQFFWHIAANIDPTLNWKPKKIIL